MIERRIKRTFLIGTIILALFAAPTAHSQDDFDEYYYRFINWFGDVIGLPDYDPSIPLSAPNLAYGTPRFAVRGSWMFNGAMASDLNRILPNIEAALNACNRTAFDRAISELNELEREANNRARRAREAFDSLFSGRTGSLWILYRMEFGVQLPTAPDLTHAEIDLWIPMRRTEHDADTIHSFRNEAELLWFRRCSTATTSEKGKRPPAKKSKSKTGPEQSKDILLRSPAIRLWGNPVNRSGAYVAFGLRHLSGETHVTEELGGVRTFTSHPSDRALGITGELGYVWALDHRWFTAVAVSYTATSLSMLHVFANGASLGTEMHGYAAAVGQIGYWATAQVALFAEAGAAVARQRLEVNFAPALAKTELVPGAVVGVGAKYRPLGSPVRFSFRYNRLMFDSISGTPTGSPFRYENRSTVDTYRATIELPIPLR